MTRLLSKLAVLAAIAAFAFASPTPGFAQAKKMMGKCNEGDRCVASCNSVKWCTVNVCTGGKWQQTMFGCAEPFCRNKKC